MKIDDLVQSVVDDWRDNADCGLSAEDFVRENAGETVPSMTTVLFGMVAEDNALAFLDASSDGSEPFAVLHSAITAEVERLALEQIADEDATDDDEEVAE